MARYTSPAPATGSAQCAALETKSCNIQCIQWDLGGSSQVSTVWKPKRHKKATHGYMVTWYMDFRFSGRSQLQNFGIFPEGNQGIGFNMIHLLLKLKSTYCTIKESKKTFNSKRKLSSARFMWIHMTWFFMTLYDMWYAVTHLWLWGGVMPPVHSRQPCH